MAKTILEAFGSEKFWQIPPLSPFLSFPPFSPHCSNEEKLREKLLRRKKGMEEKKKEEERRETKGGREEEFNIPDANEDGSEGEGKKGRSGIMCMLPFLPT